MDCVNCEFDHYAKCTALGCRNRVKNRLCDYEDTGLSPEEIRALIAEKEALVKELFEWASAKCFICKHIKNKFLSDGKMDDLCRTCLNNDKCNWEWRGIGGE